jgi:predicted metalloprotease with PDZ domain
MFAQTLIMAAAAASGNCDGSFADYKATHTAPRQFEIKAEFAAPQTEFWIGHQPSEARPEGQSESVRNLTAYDSDGQKIDIKYTGEGGWSTAVGASRIGYQLIADHDEVVWRHGADEVAHPFGDGYYFTGTAFFVGAGAEDSACPVDVSFDVPKDWTLTAPWAGKGLAGQAKTMWDLVDNGFAVGPFKPSTQKVGDLSLTSVYDERLAEQVQPYVSNLLDDMLPAYTDYFGGAPAADYSTFHFAYPSSDGSAFARSFTLQYEYPLNMIERELWAHGLAHETMHLWIGVVERTGHEIEWFTEGFTDYLAIKHLYQLGYLDDEGLRSELGSVMSRHQLGKRMSGDTSLRDAGANKGQNWFLIYGSGALIALILDAEMSVEKPGSFDDMMSELFMAGKQTYDYDSLMAFLDEHSNGRASQVYKEVNDGLRANQINTKLSPAGLGVAGMMDRTLIAFEGKCRNNKPCAPDFLKK